MEYSFVHGIRTKPEKGLLGICPLCGGEVLAKCGDMKIHHWVHKNLEDCDTWGEGETPWHRDWKNSLPEEFRERPFVDDISGERHRADVYTSLGITIEFQNSPINSNERSARIHLRLQIEALKHRCIIF